MEEHDRPRLTSGIWERALDHGDEMAEDLIDRAVKALGAGIASAVNLLDPEIVILGGGLGVRFGERLGPKIEKQMDKNLFDHEHPPEFAVAELGDLGGAIGAALLVVTLGMLRFASAPVEAERRLHPLPQSRGLGPVGGRLRRGPASGAGRRTSRRGGIWGVPESELPLLPDELEGKDAIELGCGTGYVSAWLARRGARPVGIDNSEAQLDTARRLQREHGIEFPADPRQRRAGAASRTRASTSRSPSTGPASGAIPTAGSRRPRVCCVPAASSSSSSTR